jgi:hypothetical protein
MTEILDRPALVQSAVTLETSRLHLVPRASYGQLQFLNDCIKPSIVPMAAAHLKLFSTMVLMKPFAME